MRHMTGVEGLFTDSATVTVAETPLRKEMAGSPVVHRVTTANMLSM